MTAKKKEEDLYGIDDIEEIAAEAGKQIPQPTKKKKKIGRPKRNPYAQDRKLTFSIPNALYRQLTLAGADQEKPLGQVVCEALERHLKKYEGR